MIEALLFCQDLPSFTKLSLLPRSQKTGVKLVRNTNIIFIHNVNNSVVASFRGYINQISETLLSIQVTPKNNKTQV